MMTPSNHKLVIMSCKIKCLFLHNMKYKARVNLGNLNKRVVVDQYKKELDVKLHNLPNISDNKLKDIIQAMNNTALTVLGKKPKYRFHVKIEIARLSKPQQEKSMKIENVTDNTTKNRSTADDQIKAEMLKSGPNILHELLDDIYNNISETGKNPPELTLVIITLRQTLES